MVALTPSGRRPRSATAPLGAYLSELLFNDPRFATRHPSPTSFRLGAVGSPARISRSHQQELSTRVEIESALLLEDALASYVAALIGRQVNDPRVAAVLSRLGLTGQPAVTAKQAGETIGVSGERMRQLVRTVTARRQGGPPIPYLPQLDSALTTVAQVLPIPSDDVGPLLLDAGITARSFSFESLTSAATFANRSLPFDVIGAHGETLLVRSGLGQRRPVDASVAALARHAIRQAGAVSIAQLAVSARKGGLLTAQARLLQAFERMPEFDVDKEHWVRLPGDHWQSSFVRSSLRMLAVTSPMHVQTLRQGLTRRSGFRRLPAPPPASVLELVYQASPWFSVDYGGLISPVDPASADAQLRGTHRQVIDLLRAAPGATLARHAIIGAAYEEGIRVATANSFVNYSECVQRVDCGFFAPIGYQVDTALAATRSRQRLAGLGRTNDPVRLETKIASPG